jgi:hypothetical protein
MSVLATLLAAAEAGGHASEEAEKSKTPFFFVGGLLALFAIVISVVGFKKPDFPANSAASRGVMALGLTLTLATMATIVYVSS